MLHPMLVPVLGTLLAAHKRINTNVNMHSHHAAQLAAAILVGDVKLHEYTDYIGIRVDVLVDDGLIG